MLDSFYVYFEPYGGNLAVDDRHILNTDSVNLNIARIEPEPERARRITFYNLPDTCTIRIWTLDGDLVRMLRHAETSGSADASFEIWNVITRNGQKVTTGLYIWAVESRFGTDVGKLAVIR